ncbi:unnamed protein product [Meloidogyne enterolobii]|uniref:Uncharacterized protein n=1 Tax=Meloidogyne enterolobii TaxID=390850 RepID=A0ACB0Y902_MELEN
MLLEMKKITWKYQRITWKYIRRSRHFHVILWYFHVIFFISSNIIFINLLNKYASYLFLLIFCGTFIAFCVAIGNCSETLIDSAIAAEMYIRNQNALKLSIGFWPKGAAKFLTCEHIFLRIFISW